MAINIIQRIFTLIRPTQPRKTYIFQNLFRIVLYGSLGNFFNQFDFISSQLIFCDYEKKLSGFINRRKINDDIFNVY